MTTTTSYGVLTRHADGKFLGQATAAEWRKGADAIASGNAYGTFLDEDGTTVVYVDGGPRAEVDEDDIAELRDEAGRPGDTAQVILCEQALDLGDENTEAARAECVRVILDNRMQG
jgi:hypothetical protein